MNASKNDIRLFVITIITVACILVGFAATNCIIDPFFHYSSGKDGISYDLGDYDRFINDGLLKHLNYNAVITGTSMCQNFLSSKLDDDFMVKSVKACLAGGTWREINEQCKRMFVYNKNIKLVVRGIDFDYLLTDADYIGYNDLPEYLYNGAGIDDINYLLDKRTLYNTTKDIIHTLKHFPSTTMDEYTYWGDLYEYGIDHIFTTYSIPQKSLTQEEKNTLLKSIRQNVTSIVKENRDCIFFYFIPPYSIAEFDELYSDGNLAKYLEAEHILLEECSKHENIEMYAFFDNPKVFCNLKNYKDLEHYSPDINQFILQCMKEKKHIITSETLDKYIIDEKKAIDDGLRKNILIGKDN